jgi:shikimate kinase
MSLVLFGHQFCGKSFLGSYLACKFKRPWVDTDEQIMLTYNNNYNEPLTCREIFVKHGESFFRDLESNVIQNLNLQNKAVISLGGGSLLNEASKKHLQSQGFLLWVVCSKQTLRKRTLDNLPPYYNLSSFDSFFEERFKQREDLFKSLNAPKIFLGD